MWRQQQWPHIYSSKSIDQPGKVANPARGQLNRENEYFPDRSIDQIFTQANLMSKIPFYFRVNYFTRQYESMSKYVCMVITHSRGNDQPVKVNNLARGQLNREKEHFPVSVRAWEFGLARRVQPFRPASACSFSILRLKLLCHGNRPRNPFIANTLDQGSRNTVL